MLTPPITSPDAVVATVRTRAFAVLTSAGIASLVGLPPAHLAELASYWEDLPADAHLRDGGRYRRRRHASYVIDGDAITRAPHRAHWQPLDYNALHGGIERWFEPLPDTIDASPAWSALLRAFGRIASSLAGERPWFTEAHAFRIDTTDGIGRPTPEGAHRDGVDYVFVTLIDRRGIKGGETRVFDADGPAGLRFTMTEPFTTLVLDDARILHETTPLQPLSDERSGHRDTLVVTLRAGGFMAPET